MLLLDIGYSFKQHYISFIDGDLAEVVFPDEKNGYLEVLYDPLGIEVIKGGAVYENPNRFFAHWSTKIYMEHMPLIVQLFTDPITSVYVSMALAKTIFQIFCLLLIYLWVSHLVPLEKNYKIIALVFITCLFQTYGYNHSMGIIDKAITYNFFYVWPFCLLLVFLFPFFKNLSTESDIPLKFSPIQHLLLIVLLFVLSFSSPLIPGVLGVLILIYVSCISFKLISSSMFSYSKFKDYFLKKI